MKITLLGTATSQGIPVIGCECKTCLSEDPKDKRLRVACMIENGKDRFVIDIGPDFRQQMLRTGGKEVHAILITHEHNDHVAGLDDVRPYNFKYFRDMPVYALPRVTDYLRKRFDYVFEDKPYPGAPVISLIGIEENKPFTIRETEFIPINIMHGDLPIIGFRIGDFAYLTDVKSIPETEFSKLEGLEVLVLSALHRMEHHSHLTLNEAKELAAKIGATKTYLTHLSHFMGPHAKTMSYLPEEIEVGYDGLEIKI